MYSTACKALVPTPSVNWFRILRLHKLRRIREMIKESRAAKPTFNEIHRSWRDMKLASKGSSSYGVDLAVLALCNHTIMDYGTFGMWAGLLAGGKIILPVGYSSVR